MSTPKWERCPHCKRVVSLALVMHGLGRRWMEVVELPDGDSYRRVRAEHLFPCKGRSLRIEDMLAEYAALLRERHGKPPADFAPKVRKSRRRPCRPDACEPQATAATIYGPDGLCRVVYCQHCRKEISRTPVPPTLPPPGDFTLDDNRDDRPGDPGYESDAWKR